MTKQWIIEQIAPSFISSNNQRTIRIIATLDGALSSREEKSGTVWSSGKAPVISKPEPPICLGLLTCTGAGKSLIKRDTDISLPLWPHATKCCWINLPWSSVVEEPFADSSGVPFDLTQTEKLALTKFSVEVVCKVFCVVTYHNTRPEATIEVPCGFVVEKETVCSQIVCG